MENKKSKSGSRKSSIHEEIIYDIFSRLPIDSLMRFKCLSKFYNSLVSDPSFVDIHHSCSISHPHKTKLLAQSRDENIFYTIEQKVEHKNPIIHRIDELDGTKYPEFHYVNGLFCLWSIEEHPPVIYNPITRIVKYLPSLNSINGEITCYYYSFGFEPSEKKYKILMSCNFLDIYSPTRHWVLTLGSSESWREIKSSPCLLLLLVIGEVCIEGDVYFVGVHDRRLCIVAFNIRTENFSIISLWGIFELFPARRFYDLIEVKGKLAVVDRLRWTMGGVDLRILQSCETEEWVKQTITFSDAISSSLMAYVPNFFCRSTPDGEIVFISDKKNWIIFYDLQKKSWREIKIMEFAEKMDQIQENYKI